MNKEKAFRQKKVILNETSAGTTLPDSIEIGGQSTPVHWHIGEDTFAVPYDLVTVTGTADGGLVVANVEVLPPSSHPLAYFVDSGRGGNGQFASQEKMTRAESAQVTSNLLGS